jgi:SOS-response transcriptional repressor LexA
MDTHVFVQPVAVEVDLDRHLRSGDALIVEARTAVREGELVVAECDGGPCVGRYTTTGREILLYPLEPHRTPARVPQAELRVRGVVIGMRSAL